MRKDRLVQSFLGLVAGVALLVIILIFCFLGRELFGFARNVGFESIIGLRWSPVSMTSPKFGFLPLISGTLLVTGVALVISVPIGILLGLYIGDLARERERNILKPIIELLASVPSVVVGFFGLVVVAPLVKVLFHLPSGMCALTGGLVLGGMALPTIVTLSEDAVRAVPRTYKEASLALGASRIHTVLFVILPAALPGIVAAVMLGVGRVVGETMAVMMVTGNAPQITFHPGESVRTMTATIAAEMGEVARGSLHYQALFAVGMVLLVFTLLFNMTARLFLRRSYAR